jgi:2-polyprenyl-3-methyl-5-hydroxy-6-metoxy-1,4-benzoquinol methylase
LKEINQINGVWFRYWVNKSYKIPVVGYIIRIFTAIINLPRIVKNLDAYQAFTDARLGGKADCETVEALRSILAGKADREAAEEAHLLDVLYMRFEDRFRGTREEIKRKLRVYLPNIIEITSTKEAVSILDVGCGRGEWLELLQENGYQAKGVDVSRIAVQQCRERGLDVTESDGIEYLRGLVRNSLDVITGFHIIEHLSFKTLITLFDEALAVLKPGGMIILETPNPANILVSAYDFYRDPSHVRPLHPDTVHFIAENRGFMRTGSYFVSDEGAKLTLIKSTQWKLNDINDYIQVPRDFALIGYKP